MLSVLSQSLLGVTAYPGKEGGGCPEGPWVKIKVAQFRQ